MATIKDIARQANVSTTTVSRVINNYPDVSDKTREKIMKIIKENNYRPNSIARSLSTSKSNAIGIFFTDHFNSGLHHPFFREVIYGLEKALGEKGYDIVYFTNRHWGDSFSYLDKCQDRHVDGVALMGVLRDDPDLSKLLESDLPSVFVDIDIVGKKASYVISDNISGAKKAVYYLHSLGHRRIAMIMGFNTTKTSRERFLGYQEALKELDLPYNPDWIYNGSYSEEGGYQAIEKILNLDSRPTALFCQSDGMAIGAMRAIEDAGYKVPGDFSIIGFDDIEASRYVKPALTTMAQNKERMGSSVAALLINMIEKKGQANSPIVLPVELIERESCKKVDR
ncbi:MAG: LacI family DNA-binding transcriptional regulator [Halanaerobiales bacterium]